MEDNSERWRYDMALNNECIFFCPSEKVAICIWYGVWKIGQVVYISFVSVWMQNLQQFARHWARYLVFCTIALPVTLLDLAGATERRTGSEVSGKKPLESQHIYVKHSMVFFFLSLSLQFLLSLATLNLTKWIEKKNKCILPGSSLAE